MFAILIIIIITSEVVSTRTVGMVGVLLAYLPPSFFFPFGLFDIVKVRTFKTFQLQVTTQLMLGRGPSPSTAVRTTTTAAATGASTPPKCSKPK